MTFTFLLFDSEVCLFFNKKWSELKNKSNIERRKSKLKSDQFSILLLKNKTKKKSSRPIEESELRSSTLNNNHFDYFERNYKFPSAPNHGGSCLWLLTKSKRLFYSILTSLKTTEEVPQTIIFTVEQSLDTCALMPVSS